MSAKKRTGNKTSNYLISIKKDQFDKTQESFIGKLRSNFMGTEFNLYDHGENPKRCKQMEKARREHAVIMYESKIISQSN